MKRYAFYMLLVYALTCVHAHAQPTDTIHLTLDKAESIFLENNLQLLAARYNVDIAKADVIQAGLYNNPSFSGMALAYNPVNKKVGDVYSGIGQYEFGVEQVIMLAGKRNKQIKLAEADVAISESQFYDLLRTLRYTLRSNFYSIYYLLNSYNAYQLQIASLEKLSASYKELSAKGVVTLKESVRIQALLYSLKADQASILNEVNQWQAELQLLLKNNRQFIVPDVVESTTVANTLVLQSLVDSAYANRYDLKTAQANLLYDQRNYTLQKALAVPDLTLGAAFDKRGSNVDNASFISAAIDLPFFNRNQGRIKAAKIAIDQSKTGVQQQTLAVENEVQTAWLKAINTEKTLQTIPDGFRTDFEKLLQSITENFQKKNISMVEFSDFYESYKDNILQTNILQNNRMQAIEALNFAIGKPIIN